MKYVIDPLPKDYKIMIRSKKDMHWFLAEDAKAHGIIGWRWWYREKYPTLHFQRLLRKVEYFQNCRRDPIGRLYLVVLKEQFQRTSIQLGFTIPPNTCGPGLVINHWGTIIISSLARIGRNCRLNCCVNIGIKEGKAPIIGDNVYIGPGAKIFGGISIGDNVQIGANAVVNKSFPNDVTVGGVPSIVINREPLPGSKGPAISQYCSD